MIVQRPDKGSIVSQIASYVERERGTLPTTETREAASRCLLDLVGSAAAGLSTVAATATRTVALETLRAGSIPIWFTGRTCSVVGTAWANSAAAAALDLDDGHRLARGHPGAAVIPTALAVAAQLGSTADEVLASIAIGYEVGVAVGSARVTYGNTGTWSPYAVVATAAALRGTPAGIIEHALAIAGESAPNQLFASAPSQSPPPDGSDVKEGIPWSVVTGISALDLAEAGFTGPRNILDSAAHYSFVRPLDLGSAHHIRNTYFKLYAACRHVHAPVDALLDVMHDHCIRPSEITGIEVHTYGGALRISNKVQPENLTDIQYSIPYCLGLVANRGPDSLLPLTSDAINDAAATDLAKRVTLHRDDKLDGEFPARTLARLRVTTASTSVMSRTTSPRGEATDPLSWDELEGKFRRATRLVAKLPQQNQVLATVNEARTGKLAPLLCSLTNVILL
jgi:2-methylcitrate dehydratase PrpD